MISPEWYFSTLAQSFAAIAGFIITILIVIHQLEHRERSRRSSELRELLVDLQDKYDKILYYTMSAIEQPYDSDITINIDEKNESKIVEWDIDKASKSGTPVGSQIWIYTYQISQILNNISPSENKEDHLLINQEELDLILERLQFLTKSVIGGEDSLQKEIDAKSDEGIKPSSDIFESDLINYPSLGSWFSIHFDEYDERYDLDGTSLLAIKKLFDELCKDMKNVDALSTNTHIEKETAISNYTIPLSILLVSGIILPILSIVSYPEVLLKPWQLFIYEIVLLLIASIAVLYIGHHAWREMN